MTLLIKSQHLSEQIYEKNAHERVRAEEIRLEREEKRVKQRRDWEYKRIVEERC